MQILGVLFFWSLETNTVYFIKKAAVFYQFA